MSGLLPGESVGADRFKTGDLAWWSRKVGGYRFAQNIPVRVVSVGKAKVRVQPELPDGSDSPRGARNVSPFNLSPREPRA